MENFGHNAALLVIDMQIGFDDPAWGARNNATMEANVAALIDAWRAAEAPVIHVLHDSPDPASPLRRGTPGNAPKPETAPLANERVYRKSANGAFIGTSLEEDLHDLGIDTLVVAGLTTNHCISTTARMAGNLGFETFVVADAAASFARVDLGGRLRAADEVHEGALSDLQDEFAQVVETRALLAALAPPAGAAARDSRKPLRAGLPGLY